MLSFAPDSRLILGNSVTLVMAGVGGGDTPKPNAFRRSFQSLQGYIHPILPALSNTATTYQLFT